MVAATNPEKLRDGDPWRESAMARFPRHSSVAWPVRIPEGSLHRGRARLRGCPPPWPWGSRRHFSEGRDDREDPEEPVEEGHLFLQLDHFACVPIRGTGMLHHSPPEGSCSLLAGPGPRMGSPIGGHGLYLGREQVLLSHTGLRASSPSDVILLTARRLPPSDGSWPSPLRIMYPCRLLPAPHLMKQAAPLRLLQ